MYVKLFVLVTLQITSWSNPIGFSFGKVNESPRQVINQSLSPINSTWRVEQVIERPSRSSVPEVHSSFVVGTDQENRVESETELDEPEEEVIIDDSQLGGVSLHEMFVASPSYVANIFEIAQQNDYELDESLYTSTPASALNNDSDLETDIDQEEGQEEDETSKSNDAVKTKTKSPITKPPKKKVVLPNDSEKTLKKEETLKKSNNPTNTGVKKPPKKINNESTEGE